MHSAIYQGFVRHRRFVPHAHRFCYRVFMLYLDLDELDEVLELSPLWSDKAWRPARFCRADFLGDPAVPLKQAVSDRILEATGERHDGPVRLLANLRYFGYLINPIAVYYCYDREERLRFLISEVTNTPWGERVSYVLRCDPAQRLQHAEFDKEMHVSPFNPMAMTYRWCSNDPARALALNLEARCDGETHVDATLALKRREIDRASLNRTILRYPWMTARVALAIYWQALRLWLKRTPFFAHPATRVVAPFEETDINRLKTKS